MMDLAQTELTGLTMKLDLKAREYTMLCKKLEKLKKNNIDPNDERLLWLKDLFLKNQKEIIEIKNKLNELKEKEFK